MTPYDFIQAVTNDEPKRKLKFYIDKVAVDVMVMMHVIFHLFLITTVVCDWCVKMLILHLGI